VIAIATMGAICQLYHGENKLYCDREDDAIHFVLGRKA